MNKSVKNAIAFLLMAVGAALLGWFVFSKLRTEVTSRSAIEQVEKKAAARTELPRATTTAGDQHLPAILEPLDTTLWSDVRIRAYKAANLQSSNPAIGVFRMPRLKIEAPIFAGTDDVTLDRGVGWIEGTAKMGANGNIGLAAHRDSFFRPLKDVKQGDVIEVTRVDGVDVFVVKDITIVNPSDNSVLAQTRDTRLTLVTCYPFYFVGSAPQRFIVQAIRVQSGQPTS